jgi:hypothetical protein
MSTSPMLRVVLIILGVIGLILGVIIGVVQIITMFSEEGALAYATLYPNTLSGAAQQMGILFTNIYLAMAGIMGGLLYMIPVRMGRLVRAAGYTTPNAEVVPKAYRAGGIYMIVGGVLAVIARFLFSKVDIGHQPLIMIIPLLILAFGIIGLVASLAKANN